MVIRPRLGQAGLRRQVRTRRLMSNGMLAHSSCKHGVNADDVCDDCGKHTGPDSDCTDQTRACARNRKA